MVAPVSDMTTEVARARIGAVLHNKWHIDRLLGVGGMASVYAATHRNGKRAALKVLHASAAHDPVVRARFLREGYVANRVEHPGAVSILDDDVDEDGTVFLVMELLHGETVEDRRIGGGGTVAAGDVLVIADQVLDVLSAAHGKHIVHRDLKPGNLFVTTDGVVKVLDFGIARLADMKSSPTQTTSFSSSMGTLGFMAPEQARGRWELVDARTDLWSVGATMFTLLSGRYVHDAVTANEQLLEAMTKPAPPLASLVADVPPEVAKVVDRALAFERDDRWADARAMQLAVRAAYEALTKRPIAQAPRLQASSRTTDENVEHAPTLPAFSGPGSRPSQVSGPRPVQAVTTPTAKRTRRFGMAAAGVVAVAAVTAIVLGARRTAKTAPSVATAAGVVTDSTPGASAAAATGTTTMESSPMPSSAPSASAPAAASVAPTAAPSTSPAQGPSRRAHPRIPAGSTSAAAIAPSPSASVDIFERRR